MLPAGAATVAANWSRERAMTCEFIPPYLLRHLLDDPALGAAAAQTLAIDARFRARREVPIPAPHPTGAVGAGAPLRVIHSAANSEDLPGQPVRSDGEPSRGDPAVDEAFESSAQVLALFAEKFERRSVDGEGTTLSVTVHYGENYDNAFWDGRQLVFGDGDADVFDRFTKPMDVMAHEFTHGVTQYSAGLGYSGQSGALNESVSDVFASIAKQWVANQTAGEADWLIGEGLFLPGVSGRALRSMVEPGTAYDDPRIGRDPQVGSMEDYVETTDDNGGVHINSGIPNRAFALAATGIGGYSWDRVGQVWYDALTSGDVNTGTGFAAFARVTVSAAARLFPDDVTVAQKVREAWGLVAVLPSAAAPRPATPAAAQGGDDPDRSGHPVSPTAGNQVSVRRSGGLGGTVRTGLLHLDSHPDGPQVRRLLAAVSLQSMTSTPGGADRFRYTIEYGVVRLSVGEQDLTPELRDVIRLVLASADPANGGDGGDPLS